MALPRQHSPYNENVGFMAYNALAGGMMLTGKYTDDKPAAALDNVHREMVIEMIIRTQEDEWMILVGHGHYTVIDHMRHYLPLKNMRSLLNELVCH